MVSVLLIVLYSVCIFANIWILCCPARGQLLLVWDIPAIFPTGNSTYRGAAMQRATGGATNEAGS